jgi:hypothetical protein
VGARVTRRRDGRLEVFAVGINDRVPYHQAQVVPNGGWGGWVSCPGISVIPD